MNDDGCTSRGTTVLRIGSIVWGIRDMTRAIQFWSEALHYELLHEPEEDWAILTPQAGSGPQLALKLISSEAARRHPLDLYATDKTAEVERLLGLGAQRVDWRYEDGADYVVLADPDGNRFCVIEKKA